MDAGNRTSKRSCKWELVNLSKICQDGSLNVQFTTIKARSVVSVFPMCVANPVSALGVPYGSLGMGMFLPVPLWYDSGWSAGSGD